MNNPRSRIRMLDGFIEGWIDFSDAGATARKDCTTAEAVIPELVEHEGTAA